MQKASKYQARCCNECGEAYTPTRKDELFCSIPCRKSFDNRAMVRGRELYHLFMALRYERGLAKLLGLWAIMCRMAMVWREEDIVERAGRHSWQRPSKVVERLPVVLQTTGVYQAREKIGRAAH